MEIIFLGSAGGRVAVFKQFKSSGGFLVVSDEVRVHVDPGPGALIRLTQLGLQPEDTDIFVITHKHLDHCADINTVIEAKTLGTWNKGGILLAPSSAIKDDPVVLRYIIENLDRVIYLEEGLEEEFKDITVSITMRHKHQDVETYGLIFTHGDTRLGYITDGRFEEKMLEAYRDCTILIINMTFIKERDMDHLNMKDAIELVRGIRPKLAIISHTGMEVILRGYDKVEKEIEELTGVRTIVAREFLKVNSRDLIISKLRLINPIGIRSLSEWWQERAKRANR